MSETWEGDDARGVPSTAAIVWHPIHPLLIPIPDCVFSRSILDRLAYWITSDPFSARGSLWFIIGCLVGGGVAATFGLIDFPRLCRPSEYKVGWLHFIGNSTVLV